MASLIGILGSVTEQLFYTSEPTSQPAVHPTSEGTEQTLSHTSDRGDDALINENILDTGSGRKDNGMNSMSDNDILILVILITAINLNLTPIFNITPSFLFTKKLENNGIIENTEKNSQRNTITSTSTVKKGSDYPSLTFFDSKNNSNITISVIPVFDEMVIYAAKKDLTENNDKSKVKENNMKNGVDTKKKKKILTLYVDVSQFIFPRNDQICDKNDHDNDINDKNDKNSYKSDNNDKNKNDNNRNNDRNDVSIGTYDVRLSNLSKRIDNVLFSPHITEKYVIYVCHGIQ